MPQPDPSRPAEGDLTDAERAERSRRDALLIGTGWFGTGLALKLHELPLQILLKEQLRLQADQLALFNLLGRIPIYIKPLAGVLTDSVPIRGTRRRSYLLLSLALAGGTYMALSLLPLHYGLLLAVYFFLQIWLTLTSTVLGGVMVEVGQRDHSTGVLSAQRHGITRVVEVISGPASGLLSRMAFFWTGFWCALLTLLLYPVYARGLKEPRTVQPSRAVWSEVRRQFRTLVNSRPLLAAAGLVILVIAAPGFETPLLYHQRDTLRFGLPFVGTLKAVSAIGAFLGALTFGALCRKMTLRRLLAWSIVQHAALTMLYMLYRDPTSAVIITLIEGGTLAFALLPLYDLAARATPRGSEAIGYSLMMSVWNFTKEMSDYIGSALYTKLGLTFNHLIWVNSGTTLLVLLAVPFLPAVLMDRRDGEIARH